jgi:hypothetical protein
MSAPSLSIRFSPFKCGGQPRITARRAARPRTAARCAGSAAVAVAATHHPPSPPSFPATPTATRRDAPCATVGRTPVELAADRRHAGNGGGPGRVRRRTHGAMSRSQSGAPSCNPMPPRLNTVGNAVPPCRQPARYLTNTRTNDGRT